MGILDEMKDIVTLSKESGISLSEAMNLYKMYNKASSEDKKPDTKAEQPKKTEEQDTGKEQPEGAPKNELPPKDDGNVIDYKKKVEELEEKLEKLQAENVNKDVSGIKNQKTDEEIMNNLTRSFM